MAITITSKEQAVEKTNWLRKKIEEWGKKFQGKEYITVDPKEKIELMDTLLAVEDFVSK